jgi:hypothetical protein
MGLACNSVATCGCVLAGENPDIASLIRATFACYPGQRIGDARQAIVGIVAIGGQVAVGTRDGLDLAGRSVASCASPQG